MVQCLVRIFQADTASDHTPPREVHVAALEKGAMLYENVSASSLSAPVSSQVQYTVGRQPKIATRRIPHRPTVAAVVRSFSTPRQYFDVVCGSFPWRPHSSPGRNEIRLRSAPGQVASLVPIALEEATLEARRRSGRRRSKPSLMGPSPGSDPGGVCGRLPARGPYPARERSRTPPLARPGARSPFRRRRQRLMDASLAWFIFHCSPPEAHGCRS